MGEGRDEMRNTGTPFLIRPKPLPGESSSSWRQRVGWANGYTLFPVLDERTRRSDPDVGVSLVEIDWIASLHASTSEQVTSMTLRSLIGRVVADLSLRSQPAWWLRMRMGAAKGAHGPMYCPHCLSSDAVPYYRLAWRLGFITHCEVHHTLLKDRCPGCGCAPWPSGCGIQGAVHQGFMSFRSCWRCGHMHDSHAEPSTALGMPGPAQWLGSTSVRLGEIQVSPIQALQALRAVGQLFLRNRSMRKIQSSGTEWGGVLASMSESARHTQVIEYLDVADRSVLVPAALKILGDWPASFLSFCEDTGIAREHFSGALRLQPAWMTEVVDQNLARQNRFVSQTVLQAAIADLQHEHGCRPSVTALRAHLKWQGEKGLVNFYPPKRGEASHDEWISFLRSCHQMLDQTTHEPLRSRMAASNDLVAILLGLLGAHGLRLPTDASREDMLKELEVERRTSIPDSSNLASLVDRLMFIINKDKEVSQRVLSTEHQSTRQTAKRFRALTAQLPAELARSIEAFFPAARTDGLVMAIEEKRNAQHSLS